MFNAKLDLFNDLTGNQWKVKFFGSAPLLHTLREFTPDELETDKANVGLKGVRTFWYGAHHWRGLPDLQLDTTDYEDYMWVPKRQLNEYFSREYHSVFIDIMKTR